MAGGGGMWGTVPPSRAGSGASVMAETNSNPKSCFRGGGRLSEV